jgi:hypothetical protein
MSSHKRGVFVKGIASRDADRSASEKRRLIHRARSLEYGLAMMNSKNPMMLRYALRVMSASIIAVALSLLAAAADAQWSSHDGWIEEPGFKSMNVKGGSGRAYLDSSSVRRESDGLIYFNESADVTRPDDIGKTGFMKDAYDCSRNIKYMCVEQGDWRNDKKSTVDASKDPSLPIYRKYLCGDDSSPAR